MSCTDQPMTPEQAVDLLDTALRSTCPLTFFDATVTALKAIGRYRDATATAWIGCLYAEGEIELLMSLRAAWVRGHEASPSEAARKAAQHRRTADDATAQQPVGRT